MHVAKSIWGMKKKFEEEGLTIDQLEKQSLSYRIQFLAKSYALGTQAYEEKHKVHKKPISKNSSKKKAAMLGLSEI